MKVYIVVSYSQNSDVARIVDVYATKAGAVERCVREGNRRKVTDQTTHHILTKGVKGLAGIKFETEGKKRYIKLNRG